MKKKLTVSVILIVFVILLVIAVGVPVVFDQHSYSKVDKSTSDITGLVDALELYREENGVFPSNDTGLRVLVTGNRKYLDHLPNDPWGRPYNYQIPGTHNLSSYDLWSYGRDNKMGGVGENADVTNW